MSKQNPRRTNGSRRTKLRNRVASLELPCALCGQPIDYTLPAGHPMSYELDEIVPVSKGGDPYDPDNVQPAHRICNQQKSNRMPKDGMNVQGIDPCFSPVDWMGLFGAK